MIVQRKQVVVVSLVLMLIVAGYLQYSYKTEDASLAGNLSENERKAGEPAYVEGNGTSVSEILPASGTNILTNTNDYFALTKFDREKKNDEMMEKFKKMADNTTASKEARDEATKQMINLVNSSKKELVVEQLIRAKGFDNAVVMINDKNVDVVIKVAGNLSPAQTAQIVDIVTRETNTSMKDIHIIPKN